MNGSYALFYLKVDVSLFFFGFSLPIDIVSQQPFALSSMKLFGKTTICKFFDICNHNFAFFDLKFFRYNNFSKFVVKTVYNFWKACSVSSESDGSSLHMSRLCAMLQWSSEFLCKCLLAANRSFSMINWQYLVHEAFVDFIADQSRLHELFISEYKLRDDTMKRAYESYHDILLSYTCKNSMT